MRRPVSTIGVVLAAAMLSSCTPPKIQIVVARVGGNLRATLSQDFGIVFSRKRSPCVSDVGLYNPGKYRIPDALWLVEANGDKNCITLGSVTIGYVPEGFRQVVPLRARIGAQYTLAVNGEGWGRTNLIL